MHQLGYPSRHASDGLLVVIVAGTTPERQTTKPHKLARELPEQGVQDFVADFVDRIVQEDAGGERLSREARLRMLEFMDRRGVFLVKGSIELVAQKLNLAKATLYGDLDAVRERRKTDKN